MDGRIRVVESSDGEHWSTAAVLEASGEDLRDPTFSITPTGELMMCCARMCAPLRRPRFFSRVYHSNDGVHWQATDDIAEENDWLWRVNWHQGQALGLAYGCGQQQHVHLLTSADGRRFLPLVPRLQTARFPTESAICFEGDQAICLLRRDGRPATGLVGTAAPPYTDWHWRDLRRRIGGPQLIRLADGRLLAALRLHDGQIRTALCWLDLQRARLTEILSLPSAGDCSYPGLAEHAGEILVSYYSAHECSRQRQTAVYLARLSL